MMDRCLCLCSASLVLMLVAFDGCLARPSRGYRNGEPVATEEREQGGVLKQELQMLKKMLEREDVERGLEELEERGEVGTLEREQMSREQWEKKLREREQGEREQGEREQGERELTEHEEREQGERDQREREQGESQLWEGEQGEREPGERELRERAQGEREQEEREQRTREQWERKQGERGQRENNEMEREQSDREQMQRDQWERALIEREQGERAMERDERQLEYGREQLRRQRRREVHAQAFLERFGYLPALQKNVSHDPANTKRAVRDMQRMYHLNVTGELDEMTIEMMEVPRCGMPDATPKEYLSISRTASKSGKDLETDLIAQNYYVPGHKWKKQDLTWTLRNYHQALSQAVTKNALRRAFQFWSDVSGLSFRETGESKGDINMEFVWGSHQDGPGNAFDGAGGVLAHAFYPESGETHFDQQEPWTDAKPEGINLMIVAAHELGHSLGLGHSNVQGALMAPYYQGYDPNFRLSDDDVRAIQYLYGGPDDRPEPPRPDPEPTRAAAPPVKPTTARVTTKRPTTQAASPPSGGPPDICHTIYKAITQTHDYRIYVYSGRWMWRTSEYGLDDGFPRTIATDYETPPEDITAAIFSWKTYYTYLFKGKTVWRYYGFQLVDKKHIETPGYPESPKLAITSKDNTILLVKGGNAWKFDEGLLDVTDASNPTPFRSLFPGAPETFDSAVRIVNDPNVYFFKGQNYYKYSEDAGRIVDGYPKEKAGPWMGGACGAKPYTPK